MKIAVIQGPNINMLGVREQNIYGPMSMEQIHEQMKTTAAQNGVELEFFQSNLEGEIDGIIINPAAYSHTSIAIRDALSAVALPTVEVHISNIYKREEFRQTSITAPASTGVITGFGPFGYHLALLSLTQIIGEFQAMQEAQKQQQAAQEEAK